MGLKLGLSNEKWNIGWGVLEKEVRKMFVPNGILEKITEGGTSRRLLRSKYY
jgi:hypothetical protein